MYERKPVMKENLKFWFKVWTCQMYLLATRLMPAFIRVTATMNLIKGYFGLFHYWVLMFYYQVAIYWKLCHNVWSTKLLGQTGWKTWWPLSKFPSRGKKHKLWYDTSIILLCLSNRIQKYVMTNEQSMWWPVNSFMTDDPVT